MGCSHTLAACTVHPWRGISTTSRQLLDAYARDERQRTRNVCQARSRDGDLALLFTANKRGPKAQRSAVLILPGFLSSAAQYTDMAAALLDLGHPAVEVVRIAQRDWYATLVGGSFTFYLAKLDAHLQRLHHQHGQLALVGHSAGGWIARLLLGSEVYNGQVWGRAEWVHTLMTLGTPHLSLEQYPFGRFQEKRKGEVQATGAAISGSSLAFANFFYPSGAHFAGVEVHCCVGRAVEGAPLTWRQLAAAYTPWRRQDVALAETRRRYNAFVAYQTNCGRGDVWGDGVCPLETGLLPGTAHHVMDGVWHSPGLPWYGDSHVVAQWDAFIP